MHCKVCSKTVNEIWISNDDDAKCSECFEQVIINKMMAEELKKQQEAEVQKRYGVIRAQEYKYYCPFCYEVTSWSRIN